MSLLLYLAVVAVLEIAGQTHVAAALIMLLIVGAMVSGMGQEQPARKQPGRAR